MVLRPYCKSAMCTVFNTREPATIVAARKASFRRQWKSAANITGCDGRGHGGVALPPSLLGRPEWERTGSQPPVLSGRFVIAPGPAATAPLAAPRASRLRCSTHGAQRRIDAARLATGVLRRPLARRQCRSQWLYGCRPETGRDCHRRGGAARYCAPATLASVPGPEKSGHLHTPTVHCRWCLEVCHRRGRGTRVGYYHA